MHMDMPAQHRSEREQITSAVDRTGRIAWRIQHQPFGARRDRQVQYLGAQLEAIAFTAGDEHRLAAGQGHHVGVGDPAWRRDHNRRPDRGWQIVR